MKTELSYLSQLITMIGSEGNEAQIKKLWSLVGLLAKKKVGNLKEKESIALLGEMHEFTMEQYIRIQAIHFYDGFPFTEIKQQLIQDFIEMEHCKRRDDFEGFALCAFQQLENITNYIFNEKDVWERLKKERGTKMYTGLNRKDNVAYRWGQTLGDQVTFTIKGANPEKLKADFFLKEKEKVDFLPKYKVILYYSYFKETINSYEDWNRMYDVGYNLYLCRNGNHRGSIHSDWQAAKSIELLDNKYSYYLVFLGYLADLVKNIKTNYTSTAATS